MSAVLEPVDDPPFERLESIPAYNGAVFTVFAERFRSPDGEEFERQIVRNPGAVAVVPLHDDGTVTMIRQFRPALGRSIWEIPAGLLDKPGETRFDAAARELREEVGLVASTLEELVTFAPAAGMTDEVITVFLGRGLMSVERQADGAEERHLQIRQIPLTRAVEMIGTGEIDDGKSIIGLLLVVHRGTFAGS